MPRPRSIACKHCGFLQLKRDSYCDQCGKPTANKERRTRIQLASMIITLAAGGIVFWIVRDAMTLLPH